MHQTDDVTLHYYQNKNEKCTLEKNYVSSYKLFFEHLLNFCVSAFNLKCLNRIQQNRRKNIDVDIFRYVTTLLRDSKCNIRYIQKIILEKK